MSNYMSPYQKHQWRMLYFIHHQFDDIQPYFDALNSSDNVSIL